MVNEIKLAGLKYKIEGDFEKRQDTAGEQFGNNTKLINVNIWVDKINEKDLGNEDDSFQKEYVLDLCGLKFNVKLTAFCAARYGISNCYFILVGKPYLESDGE